jgi:hypothetical protein
MKVVRFFHIRPVGVARNPKGGATVRVEGETDGGPVRVQVAMCSKKDMFCRKTGRDTAAAKAVKTIPLNQLPHLLGRTEEKMYQQLRRVRPGDRHIHDYSFATKYFKAKESNEYVLH